MVTATTLLHALTLAGLVPTDGKDDVARSLAKGGFPWYDAARDQAKPLTPPPPLDVPSVRTGWSEFDFSWLAFGQLLVFVLLSAALVALIVFLVKTWNRYLGSLEPNAKPRKAPGTASRSAVLPAGLRVETDDPWAEAKARRDQGDLSGAIVCLFVANLLALADRGLIRLAPGRTGRQLVRSIHADDLRGLAEPTLRLFEAAYYGRKPPDPTAFANAWGRAEDLRGRLAATEAGR